jgi:hypothetical protein
MEKMVREKLLKTSTSIKTPTRGPEQGHMSMGDTGR